MLSSGSRAVLLRRAPTLRARSSAAPPRRARDARLEPRLRCTIRGVDGDELCALARSAPHASAPSSQAPQPPLATATYSRPSLPLFAYLLQISPPHPPRPSRQRRQLALAPRSNSVSSLFTPPLVVVDDPAPRLRRAPWLRAPGGHRAERRCALHARVVLRLRAAHSVRRPSRSPRSSTTAHRPAAAGPAAHTPFPPSSSSTH